MYILKATNIVLTLVLLIGAVILEGVMILERAAKAAAIFITIRVVKDVKAAAVEDILRANMLPKLGVAIGIKIALVAISILAAVEKATLLVAIALLAKPKVPAPVPILVMEAQFLLREVLISAVS